MTAEIDVVVPVHNRWQLTQKCLASLIAQTAPHRVVVVDNGSTDDTPRRVAKAFPEACTIELAANLGFSIACNRGVATGGSEIVVLLNNDVECRPTFLERLVAAFGADERVGSVAALLLRPGDDRIESFGLAVDPTLAGYPRLRGQPARDAQVAHPVLAGPSGAAGAYRRAAWEDVCGLDEGVVAYGEDVDLALRLSLAGWTTAGATDAIAVHLGSASAGARSAWQRYQGGFSRGYFLRRYGIFHGRSAARALATEAVAAGGDALLFSHDLAALRGRVAGWRAAGAVPPLPYPPSNAIAHNITFMESLRLRRRVYSQDACT